MTIQEKIKEASQTLSKQKISLCQLEAEIIISFVLKIKREQLIINNNLEISKKHSQQINNLIKKRLTGEPIAYLVKEKYFYNLKFLVNKNTLIPRPESELIIEQVLQEIKNKNEQEEKRKKIIIDIGTGSGCLIISLAYNLKSNNIKYLGIDISPLALKVAKKNSQNYQLNKKINFISGNLLEPIIANIKKEKNLDIIILANLPYLTKKEIKESASIKNEPYTALFGGIDGLKYYRKLLIQIKKIKTSHNNISIYQEISPWQKNLLKDLTEKKLGLYSPKIKTIKDLNKKDRLIITTI